MPCLHNDVQTIGLIARPFAEIIVESLPLGDCIIEKNEFEKICCHYPITECITFSNFKPVLVSFLELCSLANMYKLKQIKYFVMVFIMVYLCKDTLSNVPTKQRVNYWKTVAIKAQESINYANKHSKCYAEHYNNTINLVLKSICEKCLEIALKRIE